MIYAVVKRIVKSRHSLPVGAIILLCCLIMGPLFSTSRTLGHAHYWDSSFFLMESIRAHISTGSMHLWSPYEYSGVPLLGHPETFFVSPPMLFLLLTGNSILAINFTIIASFILSGVGMYLLVYTLVKDTQAAFVSALAFMFNNVLFSFGLYGNLSVFVPLSLMPFALLFAHRAISTKRFILNSILSAVVLAIQIHSGGMIIFVYTFIMLFCYLCFYLIHKRFFKRLLTLFVLVGIIVSFSLGLSAVKLLPTFEFQEHSSRSTRFTYEEFLGGSGHYITSPEELFPTLVYGTRTLSVSPQTGILILALVVASIFMVHNKRVFFFFMLVCFSILLASNTIVSKLAYDYVPFFGNLKNIDRVLVLFGFAASVLSAYGYLYMRNQFKLPTFFSGRVSVFFLIVLVLFGVEMFATRSPITTTHVLTEPIVPILEFISVDRSAYRIHYARDAAADTASYIGSHGKSTIVLYDRGIMTGGGTIWPANLGDFLQFSIATNFPKLWGILNVKYVLSNGNLTHNGMRYHTDTAQCDYCNPDFRSHSTVYENQVVLPRASVSSKTILAVGADRPTIFSLVIHEVYNPFNTAIASVDNVEGLSQQELNNYDFVMMFRSPYDNEIPLLSHYYQQGGRIAPDIFNNQVDLPPDQLAGVLFNNDTYFRSVGFTQVNPNKYEYDVSGIEGFLKISETFAHFPGWYAYLDNRQVLIAPTDLVISGVFLDGTSSKLTIEYKPDSFYRGAYISLGFLLLSVLLIYYSIFGRKLFKAKASKKIHGKETAS